MDPHTIVSASAAVFLAVMIGAVLTVVAVIGMPACPQTTRHLKQPYDAAAG